MYIYTRIIFFSVNLSVCVNSTTSVMSSASPHLRQCLLRFYLTVDGVSFIFEKFKNIMSYTVVSRSSWPEQ